MANRLMREYQDLIEAQGGVLARWQLHDSDRDRHAADALRRSGSWRVLYRGVYAACPGKPGRESMMWAAVCRCGPHAMLSHTSAAELDRITDVAGQAIHVTVPVSNRIRLSESEFASMPRIVLHRSVRAEQARHPARTPPRPRIAETVLDLADTADDFEAAFGWMSAACSRRLVLPAQLREAARERPKLRWRADIGGALEDIAEGIHSGLERRYVRCVERPHLLPVPVRQARQRRGSRSAYLDNYYPEFGLAVELDGLGAHPAEMHWQDIHRDNWMAAAGNVTLRYNWADVSVRSCQTAAEVAVTLKRRGWAGEPRACCSSCPVGRL